MSFLDDLQPVDSICLVSRSACYLAFGDLGLNMSPRSGFLLSHSEYESKLTILHGLRQRNHRYVPPGK